MRRLLFPIINFPISSGGVVGLGCGYGNHCLLAAGQLLQSPPMSFVFLPRASKPDIVSKSALTDFTPFDVDGRRCILE